MLGGVSRSERLEREMLFPFVASRHTFFLAEPGNPMRNASDQARTTAAVERAEQEQLRQMSTAALLKQAMSEIKLLARAEVLHARLELEEARHRARAAGVLLGIGLAFCSCAVSVALVGVALALPISKTAAAFVVAGFVLAVGLVCSAVAYKRWPRKPMQRTQHRIKEDLAISKEQLA